VVVDRVRRRPVLMIGDAGRAIALLSIPIAYAFDALTLVQLYVVVFVTGTLTVFFDVAYQAYLPALVDRDQLPDGNGKLQVSESGAQIAGPAVAGGLIQWLGAPVAVLVDACSFVVSAAAVLVIRKTEPAIDRPETEEDRPGFRAEIAEGVRYVVGHRHLRWIAMCTATSNLFSSMLFAVFVLYEVRVLGFSPGVIGVVFGLGSIGFLIGAATCARITRRFAVGPTIVGSSVIAAAGVFLVPLAPHDGAVPWFIAAGLLTGFAQPVYNITQVSYRQAITPHRIQGRMNATMRFFVWGTMPIGSITGGVLGTAFGLHETVWISAIGGSLAVLPVALTSVRSIGPMPDQVEDEPVPVVHEAGLGSGPVVEVPTYT
jgi:MFS family permease